MPDLPEIVQRLTFVTDGLDDAEKEAVQGMAAIGKAVDDLQRSLDAGLDPSKALGNLRSVVAAAGQDISSFASGTSAALNSIDASKASSEIGGLSSDAIAAAADIDSALGDMLIQVSPELKDMAPETQAEAAEIQAIFARLEDQLILNPDMQTELVERAIEEVYRVGTNGASQTVEEMNASLARISVDTTRLERDIASAGKIIKSGLTEAAEQASEGMTKVLGGLGQTATGAVTATSLALGGVMAKSLYGGFQRYSTIQDAKALFETLLGSKSEAQTVMDEIVDVVTGTPFPLDQFAQLGSTMVSLNVDAAKVPGYLNAIGEAAASQGGRATQVAEVLGNAFGEMATFGRVTGDTLWSLQQAGVPATTILANAFKVSTIEMRDMVSEGMIPAGKAMDVLAEGIVSGSKGVAGTVRALGGSMAKLNENLSGAMANTGAAMNRFGASIIEKLEPAMTAGLQAIIKVLDGFGVIFKSTIGNLINSPAAQGIIDWLQELGSTSTTDMVVRLTSALDKFGSGLAPILAAFASFGAINIAGFLGPFQGLAAFLPGPFVSAMAAVILTNDEMRASLMETGKVVMDSLAPVMPKVSEAIGQLAEALAEIVVALAPAIGDMAEFGASLIEGVLPAIGPITDALGVLADILGAIPAPAIAAIAAFAGFGKLGTMFGNAGTAVSGFAEKLSGMGTLGTKVGTGVSAIGSKLSSLSANMGVWGAAASAAIGVAMFAWDAYTAKQREITARAKEVAAALDEQVDAIVKSGEAADSASVGLDALSETLVSTGEDGTKLTKALGDLGLTTDDAAKTLISIGQDPVAALKAMGEQLGLTAHEADVLAQAVEGTDAFQEQIGLWYDADDAGDVVQAAMRALGDETTVSEEKLEQYLRAMEELQDQQEKSDFDKMVEGFLSTDRATSKATQQAYLMAEAQAEAAGKAGDAMAIYEAYTAILNENTDAEGNLSVAHKYTADEMAKIRQYLPNIASAMEDYGSASDQSTTAIKKQAEAMVLAAVAAGHLTDEEAAGLSTRLESAQTAEEYKGIIDEVRASEEQAAVTAQENARSVQAAARAFDEADVAAGNYNEALDKLSGRTMGAEEANIQFQQSLAELAASTDEQSEALLNQGNLTNEGKLAFMDYLREIESATEANIRNGDSAETAAGRAAMQYEGLIQTFGQLGANTDALRAYADQMGVTPEKLETLIEAVGIETETDAIRSMLEGLQDIKPEYMTRIQTLLDKGKLTQAYRAMDRLGIPITKEVVAKAMGIKDADKQLTGLTKKKLVAIVQSQTPNIKENEANLMKLTKKQLIARIKSETPDIQKDDDKLTSVAKKDRKAQIKSETPDAKKNEADLDRVADKKRTATISSTTPNTGANENALNQVARSRSAQISSTVTNLQSVENALNNLTRDRTTRVTVVTTQAPGKQHGGPVWANRMYTVGERGPELFVPSQAGTVMPTHHPMTKLAAKLGTLQFVEPKRNDPVSVGALGVGMAAGIASTRNLSIGTMVVNQDLDMEMALTRIGMAMTEQQL